MGNKQSMEKRSSNKLRGNIPYIAAVIGVLYGATRQKGVWTTVGYATLFALLGIAAEKAVKSFEK